MQILLNPKCIAAASGHKPSKTEPASSETPHRQPQRKGGVSLTHLHSLSSPRMNEAKWKSKSISRLWGVGQAGLAP